MERHKLNRENHTKSIESLHPNIMSEMEKLYEDPYYTYDKIGKKYGISRQRIHQIFKETYGEHGIDIRNNIKRSIKAERKANNHFLSCPNDPRNSIIYSKMRGRQPSINTMIKKEVMDKATSLGFKVNIISGTRYLNINNNTITTKVCSKARTMSPTGSSKYFVFHKNESLRKKINFVICYIIPKKEYYIIPTNLFKNKTMMLYIREESTNKGNNYPDEGRWDMYKEAWYLLR